MLIDMLIVFQILGILLAAASTLTAFAFLLIVAPALFDAWIRILERLATRIDNWKKRD